MLKLHLSHLQAIKAYAENTYPEECCGLLVGHIKGNEKTVIKILPTENSWGEETIDGLQGVEGSRGERKLSKVNRFSIAPKVMLKAQKDARDCNLNIIAIYHSHTDHPAVPSEFDRVIAWPQYSYIIVSVQQGSACDVKSWSLDDNHQFQPEEILLSSPHLH